MNDTQVKPRPLDGITVVSLEHAIAAPFFRARLASGMSDVTTRSPATTCSTIQSSAASAPCGTMTLRIIGSREGRRPKLATKVTGTPCRPPTRSTSSLTGQASAST